MSQDLLGLQFATHREIGAACADDPACLRMWQALADQSAVYDDQGADGQVDEPERTLGAEAPGSGSGPCGGRGLDRLGCVSYAPLSGPPGCAR